MLRIKNRSSGSCINPHRSSKKRNRSLSGGSDCRLLSVLILVPIVQIPAPALVKSAGVLLFWVVAAA